MSNRRRFLEAAAGASVGLAALSSAHARSVPADDEGRSYYEVRRYLLGNPDQRAGLDGFFRDAALPAWERLGIRPVGVFYPEQDDRTVIVVLPHASLESVATCTRKLLKDDEYKRKGAAVLDAPADAPAFQRVESSLLVAFPAMPRLETPHRNPERVLQLRIYESPSVKTGQKKIEMFNDAGEIPIFRRTGLSPVFFGEAIVGDRLPNLTYMLSFENRAALDANWKTFIADPEWKTLSAREEYANKAILSNITNIVLRPAAYSQI